MPFRFRTLRLAALSTLLVATSAAATLSCKKDEPAPAAAPSASASSSNKEAFPVPDDLAFNPLANLVGDDSAKGPKGGEAGAAADDVPRKATLKQPGAEPRTPLVYDFSTGKSEVLVATVKGSAREEGAGAPPQSNEQPPVKFTMVVAPAPGAKKGEGGRTPFTMRVVKVDILPPGGAQIPKEIQGQLDQVAALLAKLTLTFQVDTHGVLGDLGFAGAEQMHPALAELVPMVQQTTELLFVLLPEEPIGIGAEWTSQSTNPEAGGSLNAKYTLKERTATTAVVTIETVTEMPERAVPDPRAPPGTTMAVKAKGSYTMTLRLNGPAQKSVGEKEQKIVMKDPSSTPPRAMTSLVKMQQTVESAPASAALVTPKPGAAAKPKAAASAAP